MFQAPSLKNIDFEVLSPSELKDMDDAANQIKEAYRALAKGSLNVVGECLKGQGEFYEMEHYPKGDVFDNESFSQYYYHNHREDMDEHGHFHTFMRAGGMPTNATPVLGPGEKTISKDDDPVSHVISISMNRAGFPIGLFATNRWVTGETWYSSEQVVTMLDNWSIDHASPNLAINQWISAMMRLFRPQIVELLKHRDEVVQLWGKQHPDTDVFEDRTLEVTGELEISVDQQHTHVLNAIG